MLVSERQWGEGGEGISNFPSWAEDKGRWLPACLLKGPQGQQISSKDTEKKTCGVGGFSPEILNESAEAKTELRFDGGGGVVFLF